MSRPDLPLDHVTPYDRFALSDVDIERMLVSDDHEKDLVAYFGAEEYQDLARLARQAAATPVKDPGLRVIVVPGIMGSQLGLLRKPPLPNDVLWVDPIDIELGRLATLRISRPSDTAGQPAGNSTVARPAAPRAGAPPADTPPANIVSLGVVIYSYLKLKLHLRAAGFAAVFHDYDWRLGVDELGRSFAERLRNEPCERLAVVAHSMGGLVARAWLRSRASHKRSDGTDEAARLITIGTPHRGTWLARLAMAANARQMRVDSAWMRDLAGREPPTLPGLITSWWSECDQIVYPPPTGVFPGSEAKQLRGVGHIALTAREEIWNEIRRRIDY